MIVVDWGTTNLRLFACDTDGTILDSTQSGQGIKTVPSGGFPSVLAQTISHLEASEESTIFVCGMAGARGAWYEAPYCATPIALEDIAANLTSLPGKLDGYLLPGAKNISPDGTLDVMRGEEIQIFGGMSKFDIRDGVLCLPGTHSKWVRVKDGRIVNFATFMTGDIFNALSHTILSCETDDKHDPDAFGLGLKASVLTDYGLTNRLFTARTRVLDGTLMPDQVSAYVSGLLIGYELAQAALLYERNERIVVIGSEVLCRRYRQALDHFGCKYVSLDSSEATCSGVAVLHELLEGKC